MSNYEQFETDGMVTLRRDGKGAPLVILPGAMADAYTWKAVADALQVPNPVIIVNRRGRAPSRGLGENYDLQVEIDDLNTLVKSLAEPVHLFAWSYGALIAIQAVASGLMVRSLIAYEPVSCPFVPDATEPIRRAVAAGDTGLAVELINTLVSGFDASVVEALRTGPDWQKLCRLAEPAGEEIAAINNVEPDYVSYSTIQVPLTLMVGELTEGCEPYGTAFSRFQRTMPNARLARLRGQGHLAHVEAPELLAAEIGKILDSVFE
ncbi:alpha/beta hydrolase [Paenalcaligenes niemegkensis]|uniref:alpha/beta fold hydrolase n=1 Tax=Paenalcaligenes niemegkensis TaxID=2895469 RepID=UPI001EE8A2B4|nr:alpha/beta hydrolase [Paenalcaligenes niemegkensis]MCQ9616147.1 alpha/beta hydrolase [Paenalcaligenes niemegkensis]